jgi:two-component system chemotaxis response regulator CheY
MRVLIADDQKTVGTTLAALVTQCGHDVVEVVGSGLEAIQAYTRHQPDVVLMDYWMPRLNGATACRNILARDPNAKIILVSGAALTPEITEAGAIAILPKPVSLEPLYGALYTAGTPRAKPAEPEPTDETGSAGERELLD